MIIIKINIKSESGNLGLVDSVVSNHLERSSTESYNQTIETLWLWFKGYECENHEENDWQCY